LAQAAVTVSPVIVRFDLIFMDIYLDGLSGVETVWRGRERDEFVPAAFTTSSLDFALDSYRLNVEKYLEKPVSQKAVDEILALNKKSEQGRDPAGREESPAVPGPAAALCGTAGV